MQKNTEVIFYMIEFWLDTARLMDLGRMLHLPLKRIGTPYLVHCAFSELFQQNAPSVFSVEDPNRKFADLEKTNGRSLRILCYAAIDVEALKRIAQGFASPAVFEIVDWNKAACKKMPTEYPVGMKLRFEIRTTPIMRKASAGKKWNKGQELDVFLSKAWEMDDKSFEINREDIYKEWLIELFSRKGAATIEDVEVKRFSLERMSRRNHESKRKVVVIQRPDVTFAGTLRITDAEAFKKILANGMGRHKSFGFGMLKIRRA